MPQEVINFGWYMEVGSEDLGSSRFADAVIAFKHAADAAYSTYEVACAHQMQGVALRLNRKLEEAHVAFGTATLYARGNDELLWRINRDKAMVYMDEGKLRHASDLLEDSFIGLININETEAGASLGFLARVELRIGHKDEAYRLFIVTAIMLSHGDNRTYELNNLVWLFKLVSPFVRPILLPRALRLIRQTGQRRRLVEVALLVVGGNRLYDTAERYATRRHRSPGA